MTEPVSVSELRRRARRLFERDGRMWAAAGDHSAVLDIPLHPPTERAALADLEVAREWVSSWRRFGQAEEVELTWAVRDWPRVGSQQVPERVIVRGAGALARVAGEGDRWELLVERLEALREAVGHGEATTSALRTHARSIGALDAEDFERLVGVIAWLRENPVSGRHVRELPIRGIHTKWIEARRGLVQALYRAATGATDLGLREASPLVRLRILDPALAVGGLTDVTAPVTDLAALPLRPERVFVFENLATVLAMPNVQGAVVVDGGGDRVDLVARLPWAQEVTYWGDLDSHGFAILHRLRARGVSATSALMDAKTLTDHRDLWDIDPTPNVGVLDLLFPEELATLRLLGSEGNVRLEQERIPWSYALDRLHL